MHQRSLFRVRMNSWPPAPWIFCRLVFIHQVLYSPRCAYMHPPNHRVGIELEISFRSMRKVMHQTYFSGSSSGVFSFCPCMYTFSYFAEHYYTGSDQKSILSNMLQAFLPGVQCPGTFQYPPHHSQRHHRVAVQEEVTQCHPHWLRERQQISPNLTLGTWVWWCQVRAESLLSYSHSQSGMSRSQAPPLPCDNCWRAAPTKESSWEWKNGECFIYLSIKSLLNIKKV